MCKTFYNLTPIIIKGTSYWFWYKEGISTLNDGLGEMIRDAENYWDIRFPIFLIIGVPIMYMFVAAYLPFYYRKHTLELIEEGQGVTMYNKRNTDYFKLMATLSSK